MAVMQNGKMLDDNGRLEIGQTIVRFDERIALEDCSSLRGLVKNTGLDKEQVLYGFDCGLPIYANACKCMAIAIYNAVMLFNPEKIVLTGVLATNKEFFDGVSNAYATLNNNGFAVPQMVEDISAGVGVGLAVFEKIIKLNEI
jgi:predicted NBD/HSP70 family sugar kinase